MTHCTVDSAMSRSFWIDGIATLTIATSRIVMKNAVPTTARTSHLLLWCSVIPCPLMSKVPTAREDHSASGTGHSLDDFGVPLRSAGLDQRRDAARKRLLRPVREREERVGREDRARDAVVELLRLLKRDPDGVDAALLARADADRLQVLRDHDRVRGDVLAHAPGEQQVAPLLLGDGAGDDGHRLARLDVPVTVLHEEAAGDALVVELVGGERAALAIGEDARLRLRAPCI